jgi:hypothetical protein
MAYRAAEIFKERSLWHRRVTFRVTLVAHHPLLGRPFFGRQARIRAHIARASRREERRGEINGDTGQDHGEEIGSRPVRRRHGHRHGRVLVWTHPAREHVDLCHRDHRIDEHHHDIELSKRNTDGGPERVGVR